MIETVNIIMLTNAMQLKPRYEKKNASRGGLNIEKNKIY
jgi:hypothetical protein